MAVVDPRPMVPASAIVVALGETFGLHVYYQGRYQANGKGN
jgi:hypothetical protein